jgi:hypothetical protein
MPPPEVVFPNAPKPVNAPSDLTYYAICYNRTALLITDNRGAGMGLNTQLPICAPNLGKPVAMVNSEKPQFISWGFGAIIVGFVLQITSVQEKKQKSVEQLEQELRIKRQAERKKNRKT